MFKNLKKLHDQGAQEQTTRDDIPLGCTYDAHGRVLTYKHSSGYWSEYTYDDRGNMLTRKHSEVLWSEFTRDADDRYWHHVKCGWTT